MVWKVAGWLLVLLVVVAAAAFGIAVYYSTQVLTVPADPNATLSQEILATDGQTVTLALDDYTRLPGRHGLLWDDGHALLGEQVAIDETSDPGTVTYEVAEVTRGDLQAPQDALLLAWYFDEGDEPSDRGLEFETVTPRSDVGDLESWYLPGTDDTWTIVVHGRNGDREEALRILPTLAASGSPTLVIRYRNDLGIPTSDNLLRLGDTEWLDVEAAMAWARERGAQDFVIYGFSYGGAATLQALDRAEGRDDIVALVLDAPVLDWQATLESQASLRSLPAVLGTLTGFVTELRLDIDLDDFDWVDRADELDVPILLVHGLEDAYVPWQQSREIAEARPDIVTFEPFEATEHTRAWNTDAERYEQLVAEFLAGVL